MKIAAFSTLAALALALVASPSAAHECKVVCDAAHPSPVCGSDGKTYASECFLKFAKCEKPSLKLVHDHACPDKKKSSTTTIHISVSTGKDKKKSKDDDVEEEDEASEEDDEDEDDKCSKDCTRELDQMCASDGKTYNNQCLFEVAQCRNPKLKIVDAEGPCPKKTARDGDEEEDDDSDESDDSEAEAKKVTKTKKADKCDKGCTRELDLLCASDGKTYNNHCLFENAKCRNPKLTIVDPDGACPAKTKCEKDCSRELEQLCASNGKTYNNKCLFENAKCSNSSLTIVDEDGPCPKK